MEKQIKDTVEALRQGKVILYPTDTIWGIGCDASNEAAVQRIFEIKNRPVDKSMIILVDHESKLNKYVKDVPAVAWDLIEFSEKPLTLILDSAYNVAPSLKATDGSIAIRVCLDEFCKGVIHRFGKAIVSTSANLSGEVAPPNFSEISEHIKNKMDYIVDWRQQETKKAQASTIIKLSNNGDVRIIRK